MSVKKLKALVIGSPLVAIQLAVFIYMTIFSVQACFQVFENVYVQWFYAVGIVYNLMMLVVSLVKTFLTEPGNVTAALIEKLKNQLLIPKQLEKLERTRGDINMRQYFIKCLNSAIAKHIARRPNSAINAFAGSIQTDMELLEL